MVTRNKHWYNANESTSYPLADGATQLSSDGRRLPADVVVDLNLRWPESAGRYAFLAGLSVTPSVVTAVFQTADSPDAAAAFGPLAVVSVPAPVQPGRAYPLLAQVAGAGGWIVFGSGAAPGAKPWTGRFPSPAAALLVPRAARAYRSPPVSGFGLLHHLGTASGVVTLRAEPPLVVRREERVIQGRTRDCVVVSLEDDTGIDGFPVPAELGAPGDRPAAFRFAGPCAGRPESQTCGDPQPIEFVNAVAPDCDGVITLRFSGCARLSQITDGCGAVVSCGVGLAAACLPPRIPDDEGRLPGDYDPADVPPYTPPDQGGGGESESFVELPGPPFRECFAAGPGMFEVYSGAWGVASDDSPVTECADGAYVAAFPASCPDPSSDSGSASASHSASDSESAEACFSYSEYVPFRNVYRTTTAAAYNVAVWAGTDPSTVFRRVSCVVRLEPGPAGAQHQAGLVLNQRDHLTIDGLKVWYAVELDYDAQSLRVVRFNGTAKATVVPAVVPGIVLGGWYEIVVTVVPGDTPGRTALSASVASLHDGSVSASLAVTVSNYTPSEGVFGLCADRTVASFSDFSVEEYGA